MFAFPLIPDENRDDKGNCSNAKSGVEVDYPRESKE